MKSRAVRDGDTWVLNGTKAWITNADVSEFCTVMAVTDPGRGAHGIPAFLVEKSDQGVSFYALEKKLAIKGSPTHNVIFEDARIPADRIVGEEGTAFRTALATLDHTRITIAARRWASPRAAWTTPPGTCGGVSSSASRWPRSRACSSCWPTWP